MLHNSLKVLILHNFKSLGKDFCVCNTPTSCLTRFKRPSLTRLRLAVMCYMLIMLYRELLAVKSLWMSIFTCRYGKKIFTRRSNKDNKRRTHRCACLSCGIYRLIMLHSELPPLKFCELNPFRMKTPKVFIPKRKWTSIVSSNWQQKCLHFIANQ